MQQASNAPTLMERLNNIRKYAALLYKRLSRYGFIGCRRVYFTMYDIKKTLAELIQSLKYSLN